MSKLTWQHISLIGLVIAAMFGASLLGKDFDTMGLLAVLGALGFVAAQQQAVAERTQQVKEQTNGNITRLLEQNEALMRILAVSPPIDPSALKELNDQHMAARRSASVDLSRALAPYNLPSNGVETAATTELPTVVR